MIDPAESLLAITPPGLAIPTLLGLAGAGLLMSRRIPRLMAGLAFLLALSLAVSLGVIEYWPTSAGVAQDIARVFGVLALLWSVSASLAAIRGRYVEPCGAPPSRFSSVAFEVALLLGVVVVVIQSVVLTVRTICLAVDLVIVDPFSGFHASRFGAAGLWSIGLVGAAVASSLLATRDRRLGACQFWCVVLFGAWAAVLAPVLRSIPAGGYERSGATVILLGVLACVLVGVVTVSGWLDRRWSDDTGMEPSEKVRLEDAVSPAWPGLGVSFTLVSLVVVLLTCFHLLVPPNIHGGGTFFGTLMVSMSAAVSSAACFALYRRTGLIPAAESAMCLTSFALCGLATLAVPGKSMSAAERYPMIFTAIIVGFAASTALWVGLASVGRRQREKSKGARPMIVRLVPQLTRFAFLSGALGLLTSVLMAIWPRLYTVSTMDDTLGRVTAGFAADLCLLLVVLWSARSLRRLTFHFLTILVVISCGAFVIARILPLTSRYG